MRGTLKSCSGCFQLSPKVTTIGSGGCDLCLQSQGVDSQHALIEFSEQEDCFVLQDLNSAQGTYVNDCRVQNAAVRLAPGDCIRFGYGGDPYELQVDNPSQMMQCPPVHQRTPWTQPLTVISDPVPPQVVIQQEQQQLPHLRSAVTTTMTQWERGSSARPTPPPPSMRSRPLSAGSRRPQEMHASQRSVTGWVGGHGGHGGHASAQQHAGRAFTPPQYMPHSFEDTDRQQQMNQAPTDIMAYQEKEQKILRLTEECRRLSQYEGECNRKEEVVQQLRHEIADLQGRLRRMETSSMGSADAEVTQKILQLENDLHMKRTEVTSLKEQINHMKSSPSSPEDRTTVNRQEYNERIQELNSLRTEFERCRKDKNITAGLVTQMQRDMASKDTTISRLTREIENLKKELHDKEVQVSSLQAKFFVPESPSYQHFVRTKENKAKDEEIESKDREMASLQVRFQSLEKKSEDQLSVVSSLKEELEKVRSTGQEEKETGKRLQKELDECKAKLKDIERVELQGQVDMKQLSDKSTRFRSRVISITYSAPGIKAPSDTQLLDDDTLLDQLRKLVEERTELRRSSLDTKDKINQAESNKRSLAENSKKLKQQLNEAVARLQEKGCLGRRLKQEVELMGVVSAHESVVWARDLMKELLSVLLTWELSIESALEAAGVNIKISDESPAVHIAGLSAKWEEGNKDLAELRERFDSADAKYKEDLEAALTGLRQELENGKQDDIEKAQLDSDEKMNKAIDEIRELETEKRESALEEQRAKIAELEINIEQLKSSILEQEAEQNQNKEDTRVAIEEMDKFKQEAEELRAKITELESSAGQDEEKVQKTTIELTGKYEAEAVNYKEQIKQHSVTICTMEERLNKVMKKNKDYQSEMTHLRETITELQKKLHQRPSPAPKPKVVVQRPPPTAVPGREVAVLEQLVSQLRKELSDANHFIKEQEDVIVGLRRDLQGASARMTDMTGELSEAQKEELERQKSMGKQQGAELNELRQQMAKLSTIVDRQAEEITQHNTELNKQRSIINKYKNTLNEKESALRELEEIIAREKNNNKKSLLLLEEEGRITSELTALGAQCRGERHEQVINRQREALTELRARIKTLEQARPPLPTQDQALQQVVLLKKELAELRAQQAMNGGSGAIVSSSAGGITLQEQVNKARGLDPQTRADADIERSAHRETMEALELSEATYLSLLRGIACVLEMDSVGGLRSMAHIPSDERRRLHAEREAAAEAVTSRVKVLRERIQRKDELLQGYERDLAKLRQAETLANTKHQQVESLTGDMRSRTEESQYLRETLARTKEKLEQEKRLNGAIKAKKTFHLEGDNKTNGTWSRHRCPPEDIMGKQQARKKASSEKLKRKNYEINTLKSELTEKDRNLQESRRRLVTLETTMGMESGRDPFEPPAAVSN